MKKLTWLYVVFALALAVLLGLGGLAQAGDTRNCYDKEKYDKDGDGYADESASSKPEPVRQSEKLNCPKGFVRKGKDKYDNIAAMHPRRPEIANNRMDDNCNGRTDEPEFVYPHENRDNWVTGDSFRMKIKLNDRKLYKKNRKLKARVTVQHLNNTAGSTSVDINEVRVDRQDGGRYVQLTVTGLQPGTVYRAKVQFRKASNNQRLGAHTDWYYTMTDGDSSQAKRRTAILLRGFKEYYESKMGRVAYWGTEYKDGTKYGARKGELWCSEFYAWVTKPYLEGIAKRSSVASLRRFFRQRNQYKIINTDVLTRARAGDYISMDTDDNKKKDHSGMFLAWEPSRNMVWLLEGNTSDNEVDIKQRPPQDVDGLGHISASMPLSNYEACRKWCAANSKCVKCSTKKGCGPGYKWLRSYTGPGKNYHACAERKRSKGNREACQEWCKKNRNCAKCDTNPGCGVGFKKIKSWTKGGTNWYACQERSRSKDHRAACEEWCRARSECAKCDTRRGCGPGYKRLKSWTGRGTNWHACERR